MTEMTNMLVDGETFSRNPANIELADQLEIAIVIGSPPEEVSSEFPKRHLMLAQLNGLATIK